MILTFVKEFESRWAASWAKHSCMISSISRWAYVFLVANIFSKRWGLPKRMRSVWIKNIDTMQSRLGWPLFNVTFIFCKSSLSPAELLFSGTSSSQVLWMAWFHGRLSPLQIEQIQFDPKKEHSAQDCFFPELLREEWADHCRAFKDVQMNDL